MEELGEVRVVTARRRVGCQGRTGERHDVGLWAVFYIAADVRMSADGPLKAGFLAQNLSGSRAGEDTPTAG